MIHLCPFCPQSTSSDSDQRYFFVWRLFFPPLCYIFNLYPNHRGSRSEYVSVKLFFKFVWANFNRQRKWVFYLKVIIVQCLHTTVIIIVFPFASKYKNLIKKTVKRWTSAHPRGRNDLTVSQFWWQAPSSFSHLLPTPYLHYSSCTSVIVCGTWYICTARNNSEGEGVKRRRQSNPVNLFSFPHKFILHEDSATVIIAFRSFTAAYFNLFLLLNHAGHIPSYLFKRLHGISPYYCND